MTEFGPGTFPDGLAFDREGAAWVVSFVSNRVIRVDRGGRQEIVLEDSDPEHLDWVEAAYESGTLGRPHLDRAASRRQVGWLQPRAHRCSSAIIRGSRSGR